MRILEDKSILEKADRVLAIEIEEMVRLKDRLGESFVKAVRLLTQTIEEGGKLIFKASLANIKTGIGMRDNHTKKYLGTEQWPDASLTVDKSAVKMPEDGKKTAGNAPGQFRLHGVTRDVKVAYSVERHGAEYAVDGHFGVDINDHKIEKPCYLGVCVDPKVKVDAKFKLKQK